MIKPSAQYLAKLRPLVLRSWAGQSESPQSLLSSVLLSYSEIDSQTSPFPRTASHLTLPCCLAKRQFVHIFPDCAHAQISAMEGRVAGLDELTHESSARSPHQFSFLDLGFLWFGTSSLFGRGTSWGPSRWVESVSRQRPRPSSDLAHTITNARTASS